MVLIIEQDRTEIGIDLRKTSGWTSSVANGAGAEIVIPEFGLRCFVDDLYEGTPLAPRRTTAVVHLKQTWQHEDHKATSQVTRDRARSALSVLAAPNLVGS